MLATTGVTCVMNQPISIDDRAKAQGERSTWQDLAYSGTPKPDKEFKREPEAPAPKAKEVKESKEIPDRRPEQEAPGHSPWSRKA